MKSKPNISLIVGIAIPILMVVFVACSIYLPGLFIQPKQNFLYMTGNNDAYYCNAVFEVHGGKLTSVKPQAPYNDPAYVKTACDRAFHIYDVATNEVKDLTVEEAMALSLDNSPLSSDGFEVVRGGRSGDFMFLFDVGSDYNTMYLRGHNVSRKLNIVRHEYDNYYNFQFLGWILP